MNIDPKNIVSESKHFALNIAKQISQISIQPFCKVTFHSSEYRNKETLKKKLDRIPKNKNPLIYILQIKSVEKLNTLLEHFENYHSVNKLKIAGKNRINLSRYNCTSSDVLYVGSSTTDFKTRIKNHLGTAGTQVFSLHLCKWDNSLDYDLEISVYEVISTNTETIDRLIVEILEQQFWDKLKPVFGKRSGL
jgi:hypothetical protein